MGGGGNSYFISCTYKVYLWGLCVCVCVSSEQQLIVASFIRVKSAQQMAMPLRLHRQLWAGFQVRWQEIWREIIEERPLESHKSQLKQRRSRISSASPCNRRHAHPRCFRLANYIIYCSFQLLFFLLVFWFFFTRAWYGKFS